MTEGVPKSSFELTMERLRKKDAETGVVEQKLTEEQKAAIAEARSIYEARVAELRILHRDKILTTRDATTRDEVEDLFRRDLERLAHDRDAAVKKIRGDV